MLYSITDSTAAEKYHEYVEKLEAYTTQVAEQVSDPWAYHIIDTAYDVVYAREMQRHWGHVAELQVHGLDTVTAIAVAIDNIQGMALEYRGANSTSSASNAADELVHRARLGFVKLFLGRYEGLRYGAEYIDAAMLATALKAHKDAIDAARAAKKAAEEAAHAEQYGARQNAKGKYVTHQGVRAALKKAGGIDLVGKYDGSGVKVDSEAGPATVTISRSVTTYHDFTDDELATQGYRWEGEGDERELVYNGTDGYHNDGDRVPQAWYYRGEQRPDATKELALQAEATRIIDVLHEAGYVVHEAKADQSAKNGELAYKVTGWKVQ